MITPARIKYGIAKRLNFATLEYIRLGTTESGMPNIKSPAEAAIPKETAMGTFKNINTKNSKNMVRAI